MTIDIKKEKIKQKFMLVNGMIICFLMTMMPVMKKQE